MKPTREQVIAWAREAGYLPDGFGFGAWDMKEFNEAIALAYEAGRKDENEEIAQLFEGAPKLVPSAMNTHGGCLLCGFVPSVAVEVIRARREQ
jgi:hypothetical protein